MIMDRFTRGLIAGMVAGIPMNIWSLTANYINLSDTRLLDWGAIMIFGHYPQNTIQLITGQLAQLLWTGFVGIIFSFLVPIITSRLFLLKGAFYGFIMGFVFYAIPVLLETKYLSVTSTGTAISNAISGIIWGLTLAAVLRLLNEKKVLS